MEALQKLNQEEKDRVVSRLIEQPQPCIAVVSAVRKLDDSVSGAGELPEEFEIGCQKCKEAVTDEEEKVNAFGYFYHRRCVPVE